MTDLTDVCERHGITVAQHGPTLWIASDAVKNVFEARHARSEQGVTEAAAVCALLKARWGIGTHRYSSGWGAGSSHDGSITAGADYPTELAAVVALADRLKAAG